MSINCINCLHRNPDGTVFCENCGTQLIPDDQIPIEKEEKLSLTWKIIIGYSVCFSIFFIACMIYYFLFVA